MIVFFLLSSIHSLITTTINDEVIIKLLKTKAKKKKGYNFLLRATNFKKRHNLKGEKYQNITYFHRLKKWYVSPVDSRFLPPSNFSLHVNTRLLYKGPFPIVVRPQVGNASNEGEQRCIFQPAQRYDGFLIIKEKNSMSRENSLPKPFFFPSFFFFFFHLPNRYERRTFSSLYYCPNGTILAANKTRVLSGSSLAKRLTTFEESMIINMVVRLKFQLKIAWSTRN